MVFLFCVCVSTVGLGASLPEATLDDTAQLCSAVSTAHAAQKPHDSVKVRAVPHLRLLFRAAPGCRGVGRWPSQFQAACAVHQSSLHLRRHRRRACARSTRSQPPHLPPVGCLARSPAASWPWRHPWRGSTPWSECGKPACPCAASHTLLPRSPLCSWLMLGLVGALVISIMILLALVVQCVAREACLLQAAIHAQASPVSGPSTARRH